MKVFTRRQRPTRPLSLRRRPPAASRLGLVVGALSLVVGCVAATIEPATAREPRPSEAPLSRQRLVTCAASVGAENNEPDESWSRTISKRALALLSSQSGAKRDETLASVRRLLARDDSLLEVTGDRFSPWRVAPHLALPLSALDSEARELLTSDEGERASAAYERALTAADPILIEDALERYPFADEAARASRVRAGLLLERGDLDEAVFAFEDALALDPAGDPAALVTARQARDAGMPFPRERAGENVDPSTFAGASLGMTQEPTGAAKESSVPLTLNVLVGRKRQGLAWRLTTPGYSEPRHIFVVNDTLLVVAETWGRSPATYYVSGAHGDPSWVLALDGGGAVRWQTELPARGECNGQRLYACGLGRLYVAEADQALALDARTGRIVWTRAHNLPQHLVDEGVPEGFMNAAAKCPWKDTPVYVSLDQHALEIRCGARVERLDPRTGALLSDNAPAKAPDRGETRATQGK